VVQTRAQQIQDGGRPPFLKIDKSPYLGNGSTDRHDMWHGDAHCHAAFRNRTGSENFKILKIYDGERPPFGKPLNRHISATV